MRRERGSILVMTLWILALLSLLTFAMVSRARQSTAVGANAGSESRTREYTAALAELALQRIDGDENSGVDSFREPWGEDFTMDGAALGLADDEDVVLEIRAEDEYGKVNVNLAPQALLAKVLREAGAGAIADGLAAAVADWRDADTLGAFEGDAYVGRSPAVTPPNKPLARIEELLFVAGVTPELFFGEDANHNGTLDPEEDDGALYLPPDNADGRLQPGLIDLLTVLGEGSINMNTCGAPVAWAIFSYAMPDALADNAAHVVLDRRRGPDRLDGTDDDKPFETTEAFTEALGEEAYLSCLAAGLEFEVATNAVRFHLAVTYPSLSLRREAELLVLREPQGTRVAEWHDGL